MKQIITSLFIFMVVAAPASDIQIILETMRRDVPYSYPDVSTSSFTTFLGAAQANDVEAQNKLFQEVAQHFEKVYAVTSDHNALLFSLRKEKKDFYDRCENNYAKCIEDFFKETTDRVKMQKKNFEVETLTGEKWTIKRLKYSGITDELDAIDPNDQAGLTQKIKLSDLTNKDKRFIESTLVDELFDSSKLNISCEDEDQDEIRIDKQTFTHTTYDGMQRTLTMENKGDLTLSNLLVEYQSFADQTLLGISKDLPEEYRTVGYLRIDSLAPGERIEHQIELPWVLQTTKQTVTTDYSTTFIKYPPDTHTQSEGRITGLWVKVHRITPYGERLEKEFKSSGVGSKKWSAVVPLYEQFAD